MKTKLLSLSFAAATALIVLLRIVEMIYFIDSSTGFYYTGFAPFAWITFFFLLLFAVLIFVLVHLDKPKYKGAGELHLPNLLGAILCLAGFFCDLVVKLCSPNGTPPMQIFFSVLILVFFVALVAYGIAGKAIMPILCFLPLPYWIYMLITFFIEITDMAIISENLYRMAAIILMLVCYTLLAKVICYVNLRKNARRLTVVGLTTAVIVGITHLSEYILILFKKSYVLHYTELPDMTLFISAIYMVIFIFTLNSKNNTSKGPNQAVPLQKNNTPVVLQNGF
ncbi:MAG: hypothetical protein IJW78_05300 [Clostridia bacterium]|nr:hypothetical protein [Clostridia bacterium]